MCLTMSRCVRACVRGFKRSRDESTSQTAEALQPVAASAVTTSRQVRPGACTGGFGQNLGDSQATQLVAGHTKPNCCLCSRLHLCACLFVCWRFAAAQTTPNLALMWRPDLKKYNVFFMSNTDEPVKPFSNDHIGLTFPLPTPISNAFQVCGQHAP